LECPGTAPLRPYRAGIRFFHHRLGGSQCWRTGSSMQLSREIQLGVFLIMRENMVGRGERGGGRQCELSCSSSSCGCQTDRETCVSSRVLGGGSFGEACSSRGLGYPVKRHGDGTGPRRLQGTYKVAGSRSLQEEGVRVGGCCTSSGTEGRANVSSPDGYASL
jgi:hypothetical protein